MSEARRLFMADIDPQDLTFQVHAEAMREVQREEEENQSSFRQDDVAFRQINERIYFLLLKNVSREDPLTPEEVQYLRGFRSSMSGEQWQRWLSYARAERKRLKELESGRDNNTEIPISAQKNNSSSSKPAPTTVSLADTIDAMNRTNSTDEIELPSQQEQKAAAAAADARRRSLFHMTSVPIGEILTDTPIDSSARRRSMTSSIGQRKEPPVKPSAPEPATVSARRATREPSFNRGLTSPSRAELPKPQMDNDGVAATPAAKPFLSSESGQKQGTPSRYSVLESTPIMFTHPSQEGFSTIKPNGLRASSAPRLRPTVPSNLSASITPAVNPPYPAATSTADNFRTQHTPMDRNSSSPSRLHASSRMEDYFPPKPPVWQPAVSASSTKQQLQHTPYNRTTEQIPPNSSTAASLLPHQSLKAKDHDARSAAPHLASPGRVIAEYVTKQTVQNKHNHHGSDEFKQSSYPPSRQEGNNSSNNNTNLMLDDLKDALESAQIGSNRIDNAVTAARFLMNSLNALSHQVDGQTNQNLENSRNVLEEMLKSLEKSKANFGRIEDTVTKNLKLEDLHPPVSYESLHGRKVSHPTTNSSNHNQSARHHNPPYADEYLRFQPLMDDLQSLHSQYTQPSASNHSATNNNDAVNRNRTLGASHSSILRRSAMFTQQQLQDQEYAADGDNHSNAYTQENAFSEGDDYLYTNENNNSSYDNRMWSPNKTFRGGQRLLVEDNEGLNAGVGTERGGMKNQAQNTWGLVTRICVNRGSLVKAYEEFPLRLDMEAMSLDIVWRESRLDLLRGTALTGATATTNSNSNSNSNRHLRPTVASAAHAETADLEQQRILRRERFQFDGMYIGTSADRQLQDYIRYRTRKTMENGHNLVILCNACGEQVVGELEAPVTGALGSGGGTGVATTVLQEAFRYVAQHNQHHHTNSNNNAGVESAQQQFVSTKLAQENRVSSVSFSAVLVNGNDMVDMLSNAASAQAKHHHKHHHNQPKIQRRHHNTSAHAPAGDVLLQNVTTLELSNVLDFERIVGLLLGRRTGINEAMQAVHLSLASHAHNNVYMSNHNNNNNSYSSGSDGSDLLSSSSLLASYASWNTPSTHPVTEQLRRFDPTNTAHTNSSPNTGNTNLPSSSSTMLLSFRIALGSSLLPKRVVTVRVVCPCGKDWNMPNFDLSVLAESIGALPHTPPEGLLAVSPLTMLLTDISQQPVNFVSVVHVNRVDPPPKRHHNYSNNNNSNNNHGSRSRKVPQSDQDIAMTALNTMRVACLAR